MRVLLEDYLNYIASAALAAQRGRAAAYDGCTGERYGWNFIPEVENIIAFIQGQPRNLAGDRNIDR